MGLEYYWNLLRKSWTFTFLGRHVTIGFWIKILTDRVLPEANPSVDNTTQYAYTPLLPSSIRIFTLLPGNYEDPLKGTLTHHGDAAKETPSYESLSYIWGDPVPSSPSPIQINTHHLPVTQNLETALRHLRSPVVPRTLWIDALCIDQTNRAERSVQVARMLTIYESATRVIIWLGPSTLNTRYGMQILSFLASREPFERAPWITHPEQPFAAGLKELIARPWFQRMWVIQEAAVSRHATMICGADEFSWTGSPLSARRFMRRLKYAAISPAWEQAGLAATNPGSFLQVLNLQVQFTQRTRGQEGTPEFPVDILDLAFELRHRRASDRRDKLFSILGLVDPRSGEDLVPDYEMNVEEVFERLSSLVEV